MKTLGRPLLILAFSIGILYFMGEKGLLDVKDIGGALAKNPRIIAWIVGLQIVGQLTMLMRYKLLLNGLGIKIRFAHVTAATFVSNAVGQWLPGSLAFIELLRIGLMIGAGKHHEVTT